MLLLDHLLESQTTLYQFLGVVHHVFTLASSLEAEVAWTGNGD